MAASMKGDAFYASTAAVCRDSLVVTGCTCKAGSHGLERGVCVHNIPLILQLVLLLVDGLANHILVELCHRWSSHLESKIEELGQLEMAKRAILMLMKANGSENTSSLCHLSVNEILSKMYDVGTEKPKSFGFPEPKDEEFTFTTNEKTGTRKEGAFKTKVKKSKTKTNKELFSVVEKSY